ncbi:MAG: hypothetical protein R3Y63_04815 [Eubacteriales bacterium]
MKQNEKNNGENKIFIKQIKKWVVVDSDFFEAYMKDTNNYRYREQYHGRCKCPKGEFWRCDTECYTCKHRITGKELSLDYEFENSEGDSFSLLNSLVDEKADLQTIIENTELLEKLTEELEKLNKRQ